jgi:hypothetical protein
MISSTSREPSFPVSYPLPEAKAALAAGGGLSTVDNYVKTGVDLYAASREGLVLRGEYRRFAALIYPGDAAQAKATGRPVESYWFGERIRVYPDGSFSPIDRPASLEAFYALPREEPTYVGRCVGNPPPTGALTGVLLTRSANPDFTAWAMANCHYELIPGGGALPSVVSSGSSLGLLLLGAGIAAFFLIRKFVF